MATNLSQRIEELARQVATDQIAQDIANNEKFAPKTAVSDLERLVILELKVNELISVCWTESKVEQITITTSTSTSEMSERLTALENKLNELIESAWVEEKVEPLRL